MPLLMSLPLIGGKAKLDREIKRPKMLIIVKVFLTFTTLNPPILPFFELKENSQLDK